MKHLSSSIATPRTALKDASARGTISPSALGGGETRTMIKGTTALAVALAAVETFRKECRTDIGGQTISCFLQIAMHREMPMFDLIKLLDVSNAAVSRNITLLGTGTPKDPGMGLVEAYEDAYFRRRKIVRITQKGSALMATLVENMNNVKGL